MATGIVLMFVPACLTNVTAVLHGRLKCLCYIQPMLTDSDMVTDCWVLPGTLSGLISLYEANFIKLSALLGDLRVLRGRAIARSDLDCDLHVLVEEGSRYARQLRLTYVFEEPAGTVAEPDLLVKLYLDARVAEVLVWNHAHRHETLTALARRYARELDRRWACNMVLSKWLDYLLDRGYTWVVNPAR